MTSNLEKYILNHIDKEPQILKDVDRAVHRDLLWSRMVSGHLQGRVLYMLCTMIKPQSVLEIGTFAGYSALCMAEAMDQGSTLHTIEINDELEDFTRHFFESSSYADIIKFHIGDASNIVPCIDTMFDLVFIDGNKRHYAQHYDMIFDKVSPGGYIIADNILWDGKVVQEVSGKDQQTHSIIGFNKKIQDDDRVENVIFPIRDGMMVVRKKYN